MKKLRPLILLLLVAALAAACGSPAQGPVEYVLLTPEEVPEPVRERLEQRHIHPEDDTGWIHYRGHAYAYIVTEERVRTEVLSLTFAESLVYELTYRFRPVTDAAEATPVTLVRFRHPVVRAAFARGLGSSVFLRTLQEPQPSFQGLGQLIQG